MNLRGGVSSFKNYKYLPAHTCIFFLEKKPIENVHSVNTRSVNTENPVIEKSYI